VQNPNLPTLYQPGGLTAPRQSRALTKQLRGLHDSTSTELARVRAIEAIEVAKLEALETAGHVGEAAAANLSAHELLLVERDPHCFGRVKFVADATCYAIGSRIEKLDRRLG
jgi:hypothetical protein